MPTTYKMAGNSIHILCTRPVDTALIEQAAASGIQVDVIEFIHTVAIGGDVLSKEMDAVSVSASNVIFTSMNAVEAVTDLLHGKKPRWNIYCMGNTTRQLVIKYFGEASLKGTGFNATDLANTIASNRIATKDTNDCIFFCGDQRRDELPAILQANDISLKEITVYKTIETTNKVEKSYDAILFFSPSAVHSFFKTNRVNNRTVFYAIGETTASAIKQYAVNKIIIGNTPAKDELFRLCISNFTERNNNRQTEINTGNGQPATGN